MSFELTAQELALYTDTGFLVRHGVFAQREIEAFRLGADAALATAYAMTATPTARRYSLDGNLFVDVGHVTVQFEHSLDAQKIRVIEPVHHLHEVFEALVDDARLVQPMCQLIGENKVSLWTAKFNAKSPEIGSGFGWHQDSPYWVHDNEDVARLPNVMLNFDDSSIANGCLHLIRGSHKAGMLPGCSDGRQLAGFYTDPNFVNEDDQVPIEVPAGSLVFFDPLVVHGSPANTSKQPRRGIILTYQPWGRPTLKRGDVRNAGC